MCSQEMTSKFSRNHYVATETEGTNVRITYRFEEEDAEDGTSFAPSDPSRSTRQFPSSKHHKYNECGHESAPTQSKEEDLTTRLSPSSLRPVSFK